MSRAVETEYGLACSNCYEKVGHCSCQFGSCAICHEDFPDSELYEYRGVEACEKHFQEAQGKRDYQRRQVMETTEKSVRSQAGGEWSNGGYKTMKTDMSGSPIPTKTIEPLSLKDYEDGKL